MKLSENKCLKLILTRKQLNFSFTILFAYYLIKLERQQGFPAGSGGKVFAYNAGDPGSIPGTARSPGEGDGNLLQYTCLENPMDGEALQATVHGVPKSWT